MNKDKLIKILKPESTIIMVDHVKTKQPTALDGFEIIKENDGSFICIRKSIVENLTFKDFSTFYKVKNYLIKVINDYQQSTYTPIEFKVKTRRAA